MGRFDYLFPTVTDATVRGLVEEEKEYVLQLNREQMYDEGVMDITRPNEKLKYAESTKSQKKKKATFKKVDYITLRWFGEFYRKMRVLFFSDYFVISSDDLIWARYLEPQKRFTKALGLTKESKGKLRDRLKDAWLRNHK